MLMVHDESLTIYIKGTQITTVVHVYQVMYRRSQLVTGEGKVEDNFWMQFYVGQTNVSFQRNQSRQVPD